MKEFKIICVVAVVLSLGLVGCSQQAKSADSREAIATAKTLNTAEEKADFLIKEAKGFLSSEKYDDALKTASYVSKEFESGKEQALKIIEEAKAELIQLAEAKADELKNKLTGLGQ